MAWSDAARAAAAEVRRQHSRAKGRWKSSAGLRKVITKSQNKVYRQGLAAEIRAARAGAGSVSEATLLRAIASQSARRRSRGGG
jgi:hypothetical protein